MHSGPLTFLLLAALPLAAATAGDRGADGRFDSRRSSHFILYQDVDIDDYSGWGGSRAFEIDVLDALENAHDRVGQILGLRPRAPIRVVVYDAGDFQARFDGLFRFRAAGFYDGRIHVRGATRVDARLVRTLHHEYVHAALEASASGYALQGWVNEGLAEWFENLALGKRRLSAGEQRVLADAAARGALVSLRELDGRGFSGLDPAAASVAYLASYAAIEHLARRGGDRSLRRFVDQLIALRSAERALARVYRLDLDELEATLRRELGVRPADR